MSFLTKSEKWIIAFLVFGAVFGVCYSYYKESHPPLKVSFRQSSFRPKPGPRKDLDNLLIEAKSVNVNTASLKELMRLDGIGPVLAGRIIEYRQNRGHFTSKEELREVSGISQKKFEAIRGYIEVE